ncbi:MAG: hypothetical protein ACLPHI_22040 [Terriglobales bacterium]
MVEIFLCDEKHQQLLNEWCEKHKLKPGSFAGQPVQANCVERLKGKIAEKQRQLPKDQPGVILVLDNDAFFRAEVRTLIREVEEEVFRYPHVPVVIVCGKSLSSEPPEVVQIGQHRYTLRSDDLMTERHIFLLNRYSSVPLSTSLLSQFWRAFA